MVGSSGILFAVGMVWLQEARGMFASRERIVDG